MTVQDFLERATATLKQAGIESARLDILVLLEDALGRDRAELLAHPESQIPYQTEVELNTKVIQRSRHTPLAYIRGKAEFYGREFAINENVLVPRPETETIIDLLKQIVDRQLPVTIIDIGTGSGAIAITAKVELPNATVIATDIDTDALKVARKNAKTLHADVAFLQGDLLEPLKTIQPPDSPSILMANLPYVPEYYGINQAAEHEPKHAIFGGKDGLNLYRRFWQQIGDLTEELPVFVLTEALPPQHAAILNLANTAGFTLHATQDFIQVFKKS